MDADVDYFLARVATIPPEKSKRTWKWVAHGNLLNKSLREFSS